MTLEKDILKHIPPTAKKYGLRALRISMRPGVEVGWADTCVFGPNRHQIWIETKRPGEDPTPMQLERARTVVSYGFAWAKCDTKEDVEYTLYSFAAYCINERPKSREEFLATLRGRMN